MYCTYMIRESFQSIEVLNTSQKRWPMQQDSKKPLKTFDESYVELTLKQFHKKSNILKL